MNKSVSNSIEKSVKHALTLISKPRPKLILGVSGGPDSMALLYALYKAEVDVFVIHINYGLRGKSSELDQELVEGMSSEWGFDCYSAVINIDAQQGNFQKLARNERYRIFKEFKNELNADAIVTAHHQDDQVETILQKILRGSGVEAWQGMSVWNRDYLRPLLSFTKSEILEFCNDNAIPYRIDESNLASNYARNLLRNEVFGKFESFFPGWKKNILSLSEKGKTTELAIHHIYKSMLSDRGLLLDDFTEIDISLKSAVLKHYIAQHSPETSLSKGLINSLLEIEDKQVGVTIPISDTLKLIRERETIVLKTEDLSPKIRTEITENEVLNEFRMKGVSLSISKTLNENALYLDADLIQWPLILRNWEHGDKFQPLGMTGIQKISDLLTNRKIPSSIREKALILSAVDSTIYAIIFPVNSGNAELGSISEIKKCTTHTTNYLIINQK